MADIETLLRDLVQRGSDLHLKVGSPPHLRIDGRLVALPGTALTAPDLDALAASVLPTGRSDDLDREGEVDFALSVPQVGRFRVNVHRQRGALGLVIRRVVPGLPSFEQLGLPPALLRLADEPFGLVLVAGPAGSGRTTTVAALVDRINESRSASIVTVESPVEVLHPDKRSIVSQREVGTDTPSFATGVVRAMRHDPDVVVVGDVADAATARAVLDASVTGHLVIAVLSAPTVATTIERLVGLFAREDQRWARQQLAQCLRGAVCQRLLERADGRGRLPVVEVLVGTSRVVDALADPGRSLDDLAVLMAEGTYSGMQTLDQHLLDLCRASVVPVRSALLVATAPEDLRLSLHAAGMAVL